MFDGMIDRILQKLEDIIIKVRGKKAHAIPATKPI